MYWFELQDITFLLKCLQDPNDHMNIHVTFASSITRAGNAGKLKSNHCKTSTIRHFFFNRVVRLWNSLPNNLIDLSQSVETNKRRVFKYLWSHFTSHFDSSNHCTFHAICPCSRCYPQWLKLAHNI